MRMLGCELTNPKRSEGLYLPDTGFRPIDTKERRPTMAKERPARPSSSADSPATIPVTKTVAHAKDRQKSGKKRGEGCRQLTLWISEELSFRLDFLARMKKTGKTAFAVKLLDQGCSQYNADSGLKTAFAEICLKAREDTKESAA